MSSQQTPPSLRLTKAGWLALILSVAAGVGLRLALQAYDPEKYVQTTRNDPRQGGLAAMILIPAFALCAWVAFTLLGYPLFRGSLPPVLTPSDRDTPGSPDSTT